MDLKEWVICDLLDVGKEGRSDVIIQSKIREKVWNDET